MFRSRSRTDHFYLLQLALSLWLAPALSWGASERVDFVRDIRPILADNCYACHGPDEEERQGGNYELGGLRFDTREGAFAPLEDERFAIVPGQPDQSELIRRVESSDESEVMPPADHRKRLTGNQKSLLRRWIEQGASWSDHWSYQRPRKSPCPPVRQMARVRNWIDRFVLSRLESESIPPSPAADKRTLIRRLSFDLTGLPPEPADVERFLADSSEQAWERLVDQYLDSPHYGERMAIYWLDLVRYADTVGYHGDQDVSVSPYRDYVISAFNSNLPFDQFTREQLAGDLLADPTQQQLIASGYNKLGMMSAEGGVQDKEYLAKYAAERVRTASAVWMGSTLGCAECHDHKFDPFTARDFYRFAAFFADIKERGLYSGAHADGNWGPQVTVVDEGLAELRAPLDARIAELENQLTREAAGKLDAQREWEARLRKLGSAEDHADLQGLSAEERRVLALPAAERTPSEVAVVAACFRRTAPQFAKLRQRIQSAEEELADVVKEHTRSSLITVAVEPRTIRILPRGNWMDDSGPIVGPGVPAFLPQIERGDRATRLDLANWLVARDNPLTARVMVNRFWRLLFGTGLSKVLDDVGAQGEPPVYPELLDTLAVEFMDHGWDVKWLLKQIVMSGTYRQTSRMRDDLQRRDPYNRLLARQSRFRLDAEMVRDNALAVSGLLVRRIGGRSVKPYQPAGLYRHLNFPQRTYTADTGTSQYRRGVYTHWQRQFLHPAMKSFDAPSREECTAERSRSNTPLAALVLLNDPSYVEAARVLAQRALRAPADSPDDRLDWIMTRALSRPATDAERSVLRELLHSQLSRYRDLPAAAERLIDVGQAPIPDDVDAVQLAAWTNVGRAVFNLHEFITRN